MLRDGRLMAAFVLYDILGNASFAEHCLGPLLKWYAMCSGNMENGKFEKKAK
jgi:hypothetical protein